MSRRAFVTVGSTKFPELVRAVLTSATITLLAELGFDELCVQYGTDKQLFVEETRQPSETLSITGFDYSPSIEQEMENADLVISHAGSGSVLEALHMGKVLVVVPNASLMDNHQAEVAKALSDEGYLLQSTPNTLSETLAKLKDEPELRPFPASGNKGFARILDKELGLA